LQLFNNSSDVAANAIFRIIVEAVPLALQCAPVDQVHKKISTLFSFKEEVVCIMQLDSVDF
jgi:hypothetical protein